MWVNGVEVGAEAPAVSALDRGFLYGWAVFETLRVEGRRVAHLERHAQRLEAAARSLGGVRPSLGWRQDLHQAVAVAAFPAAAARVAVTAGGAPAGRWAAPALGPSRVIWLREVPPLGARPLVGSAVLRRPRPGFEPSGLKTHAYVGSMAAVAEAAHTSGADEVLWLGADGCVDEGATSNVFAVIEGRYVAPPIRTAMRPGVTREVVLAALRRDGHRVEERRLTRSSLCAAAEVFVTSSLRGVLVLTQLDGRPVGSGKPGPKAQRAFELWKGSLSLE